MRGLVLCALLPACLTPSLTPCGSLLCADGAVCVADTVCAYPEQLEACAGVDEEDPCNSTFGPGHCVRGVCVANVCGDGVVTGIEPCDSAVVNTSCQAFGFYEGTVTCSPACVPDPGGCTGRCGDAIVQSEFGEQCDTAPPVEGCLDFGHDYGVLTCNSFCAPAITHDCRRYGWDLVLPETTTYTSVAGNAHGVVGIHAAGIDVVWDGVSSTRTNPGWTATVANATMLVAIGASSLGWFDGQWHEVATGLASQNWLTLADDGHLFARTDAQCTISQLDVISGAQTSVAVPPIAQCASGTALSATQLFVPQGSDGVRVWNGSAWSVASPSPVAAAAVLRAGPDRLAIQTASQTFYGTVSGSSLTVGPGWFGGTSSRSCAHDEHNEVCLVTPTEGNELLLELRAHQARFYFDDLPSAAKVGIVRSADGRLIVYGAGVRVMRPRAASEALPSDASIEQLYRAEDGLIACGADAYITGISGFAQRNWNGGSNGTCKAVAGFALGEHFFLTSSGIYRYNAGSNSYALFAGGGFTSIAGDHTLLWTTYNDNLMSFANGDSAQSTSAPHPATCKITRLAMSANHRFVGAGTCGGTIAAFAATGSTWSAIATSNIAASGTLEVAAGDDDSVFVRNGADVYRVDGSALTLVGHGQSVRALAADNFFIDQGGETMLHVSPTRTQEIRLSSGPFVATPGHLFAWDIISRRVKMVALLPEQPDGP